MAETFLNKNQIAANLVPVNEWFTNETGTTLNTGLDLESANLVKVYRNGLLLKKSTNISTSVWYATPSGQNDKYLGLGSISLNTANSWSIVGSIKITSNFSSSQYTGTFFGAKGQPSYYSPCMDVLPSYFGAHLSSNGSNWNILNKNNLGPVWQVGNYYNFDLTFTGTEYNVYIWERGTTKTLQAFAQSSSKVAGPCDISLLNAYIGSYNYSFDFGKFCMSDFKITADNSVIFDGSTAVEGTDFTNVGCTRSTETQQDGGYMISSQSIVFENSLTTTDEICVELY